MIRRNWSTNSREARLPQSVITSELFIRLDFFLGVLGAMAVWELLTPRRPPAIGRLRRWPNNLGLVLLNTMAVRLVFPLLVLGLPSSHRPTDGAFSTSCRSRHG
jgi:hypothetical protein